MVPEEQYGPWKGMLPPYTHPSAVPMDRYQKPPARRVPFRGVLAGFPSALVGLTGVWLLAGPLLIDHPATAHTGNAVWNDLVTGGLLAVFGAIRSVSPFSTRWLAWVTIAIGAWLVASPFVLRYRAPGDVSAVTLNDVVIGALAILLTLVGLLLTQWWSKKERVENHVEGNGTQNGETT